MLINLIFILILNKFIESVIVLPIYTLPYDNYKNSKNKDNILKEVIYSYYKSYFYTFIQLGHPLQTIPLLIKPQQNSFIITSINSIENCTSYKYIDTFNFSESFLIKNNFSFYNEKKSNSFILNKCDYGRFYEAEEVCVCNDNFLFFNNISLTHMIQREKLFFHMARNVEDNITGEIGLNLYDKNQIFDISFIFILKRNNLIDNYNWYFDIKNKNEIKLIIGALPHEIEPDIYSLDDLTYSKTEMNNFMIYWRMNFNKIFAKNCDIFASLRYFNDTLAEFKFDSDIIIGTDEYSNYLFKILDDLFKNKKCFNDSIIDYKNQKDKLIFIYCKNEKNILNQLNDSLLPNIYFYSVDLNYTFEINSNDLLMIKGDFIYLKILFSSKGNKIWKLGKLFSLKYQFTFNPETKQIGFYRNIKQIISSILKKVEKNGKIDKQKINTRNYLVYKIILVIILIIVFVYLFWKYYKIICNLKRQKRKNEITLINDVKTNVDNNLKEMENLNDGNEK